MEGHEHIHVRIHVHFHKRALTLTLKLTHIHVQVRVRVRVRVFFFVIACCRCCRCGLWWSRERKGGDKPKQSQLIPSAVSLRIAETEQLYQAQRMLGGIGNVLLSTYSQTENGEDPLVSLVNL